MLATKCIGKLSALKICSLVGQKAFGTANGAKAGHGFRPTMALFKPTMGPVVFSRGFIIKDPHPKEVDEPCVPILGPVLNHNYWVDPEAAKPAEVEAIKAKTEEIEPVANIAQEEPADQEKAEKKKEPSIWWDRTVCVTCFGAFMAITGCLTSMLEATDDTTYAGIPTGHLVGIMFR